MLRSRVAIRADVQMLYRVNDSIYSAKIAGSQIIGSTLIVKEDDVRADSRLRQPALAGRLEVLQTALRGKTKRDSAGGQMTEASNVESC